MLELAKEKRRNFFVAVVFPKDIFWKDKICVLSQCIEYTFRINIVLYIKKHYFIHFCCLFLKLSKALSASLNENIDKKNRWYCYMDIKILIMTEGKLNHIHLK